MKNKFELFDSILIDKTGKTPLYLQLYEKLKGIIVDGILCPDFRLPSIRQLSDIMGINKVTVVSAFKELENEGYVYSKPGSGTYVSEVLPLCKNKVLLDSFPVLDELYQQDDIFLINNGRIKITESMVNFASATPTPDLFPVEDFKCALNEVLERDRGNAFGYQDSQGFYPIRESILNILKKYKINSCPDNIQIISGAQQGIDIISKAFLKQGDYVITESPTYTGAIAVFKSRGAQIADVEMRAEGPDLNLLEYNIKKFKPKFVYTIPSFQNPTGYSYPDWKRIELLKLSEKYGFLIVEDDYVSDLDFDERNHLSLKALDKHNRVIFIKSFSKIFMPGLRLGFMIVPTELSGNILEAKHTTDISTSGLIQRAFDLYIRKGYWDRHYKFMYEIYRERYEKMIASLDKYLPHTLHYTKPGGGLNIWLNLPYGFPVNSLTKQAASSDIVFAPGRIFYSSGSVQKLSSIRLSFASVCVGQIERGVQTLCSLIPLLEQNQVQRDLPVL